MIRVSELGFYLIKIVSNNLRICDVHHISQC